VVEGDLRPSPVPGSVDSAYGQHGREKQEDLK
jgi:hypothetical protein